jgi:hypothetical protein
MARPTFYLDECVNHEVIPFLRAQGITIETAQGQGQAQQQIPDNAQLQFATTHGCVLLTTNADHVRNAHTRFARAGQQHAGIITLAPEALHLPRYFLRCAMLIDWLEQEYPDPRNRLLRWSDLQMRLDRGEIAMPAYAAAHIAYASGRTTTAPAALLVAMQQAEDISSNAHSDTCAVTRSLPSAMRS